MDDYKMKTEKEMPYPRVCAHRGFSTLAPENSMPAFGAAVALDADEIEFDLWWTKDGEIISIHDQYLERVSDGEGLVTEHTYAELLRYDFGLDNPSLKGLRIIKFEEILQKFACRVIMNVHLKSQDDVSPYDEDTLNKILGLIKKYRCEEYVYFMITNDTVIKQVQRIAPEIEICAGVNSERQWELVDRAIKLNVKKVQLYKPYFNEEMIEKAHKNGIKCNVFWSDEPTEAKRFIDMGIDTVLTNNFYVVSTAIKEHVKSKI